MLLTLKWMNNLQYIKCHQWICQLFFMFSLTCCEFVSLKENTPTHSFQNHYSKQTKHPPQSLPYGEIRMSHWGKEMGGGSLWKPKSLNFPLLLDIIPNKKLSPYVHTLTTVTTYLEKKISLITFRQILPKLLFAAYIFSNTTMTNLKKLIEKKSLNTKQCSAELSPRNIP